MRVRRANEWGKVTEFQINTKESQRLLLAFPTTLSVCKIEGTDITIYCDKTTEILGSITDAINKVNKLAKKAAKLINQK